MSDSAAPRRVLQLVVEGLSPVRREELVSSASGAHTAGASIEILMLTETNGREALEKIFHADSVMVWGELTP